jgi:hypothetical protein
MDEGYDCPEAAPATTEAYEDLLGMNPGAPVGMLSGTPGEPVGYEFVMSSPSQQLDKSRRQISQLCLGHRVCQNLTRRFLSLDVNVRWVVLISVVV